jgi:YD repeat-containing protein
MDKKTRSIAISRYNYILRDGYEEEVDILGLPHQHTEFDPDGHPLIETRYSSQGDFEERYEYGYDERGNLVRESYYPTETELAEEKTFVRDEAGIIVHALKRYQDGSVDTIAYTYDEEGRLVKRTTVTEEGETDLIETFEWENGEVVKHQIVDDQGDVIPEPDYTRQPSGNIRETLDDKGQLIREEEINETGDVVMAINRTYDDDGRPDTVDVFIDGQGKTLTRHYFLKYEYTFFE